MTNAYHCPNCKTNRTRFNIIHQNAAPVKMDAQTGEVLTNYTDDSIAPYHLTYQGPAYKVQCGVCGLVENEEMFVHYAQYSKKEQS